jgi:hypothetical protein
MQQNVLKPFRGRRETGGHDPVFDCEKRGLITKTQLLQQYLSNLNDYLISLFSLIVDTGSLHNFAMSSPNSLSFFILFFRNKVPVIDRNL